MAKLRKSSIKREVHDIIKEKIMSQQLQLGEKISLVQLAEELGVSNTPIREAISMLEAEGLVTTSLNAKVQVIDFTEESYAQLNATFELLVEGAYRLCTENGVEEELCQRMRDCIAEQEARLLAGDFRGYIEASLRFDRCPLEMTGNERLISIFDNLGSVLFLAVRFDHQNNGQDERTKNLAEHLAILEAAERRDHDAVRRLLRRHYRKQMDPA